VAGAVYGAATTELAVLPTVMSDRRPATARSRGRSRGKGSRIVSISAPRNASVFISSAKSRGRAARRADRFPPPPHASLAADKIAIGDVERFSAKLTAASDDLPRRLAATTT